MNGTTPWNGSLVGSRVLSIIPCSIVSTSHQEPQSNNAEPGAGPSGETENGAAANQETWPQQIVTEHELVVEMRLATEESLRQENTNAQSSAPSQPTEAPTENNNSSEAAPTVKVKSWSKMTIKDVKKEMLWQEMKNRNSKSKLELKYRKDLYSLEKKFMERKYTAELEIYEIKKALLHKELENKSLLSTLASYLAE